MTIKNGDGEEPDFFRLNQHQLDREWIEQPRLYHQYATQLAAARETYEQSKSERDVVAAELDHEIRSHPGKFKIDRVTESVVQNTILLQLSHRKAERRVRKAKHELDILQAAVDTLEHRKKALENLVVLWSRDYFAAPRTNDDTGREAARKAETAAAFVSRRKRE